MVTQKTSTMGDRGTSIEKLGNENYFLWQVKMKMLLVKEKLWKYVEGAPAEPLNPEAAEKEQEALALILLNIGDDQFVICRSATSGREAWGLLRAYHMRNTSANKVRILTKIFTMKLAPGGKMDEHLLKMEQEFAKLESALDGAWNEDIMVAAMLASLPPEYDQVRTAIDAWQDARFTISSVKSQLLEEWEKKRKYAEEVVFVCNLGVPSKKQDVFSCFYCHSKGHMKRNCLLLKRHREESSGGSSNNKESSTKVNENKQSAKMARYEKWYKNCFNLSSKIWLIDSGATSHMVSDKNLFATCDKGDFGKITVANGERVKIEGKGTVRISLQVDGDEMLEVILDDVLYVPSLDTNLVSVKRLTEKGFEVSFSVFGCKIRKDNDDDGIIIGTCKDGLYILSQNIQESSCLSRSCRELCVHEWHNVLAHRNLGDIRKLRDKGLRVRDCECTDICEACIQGKMSRKSFPKKSNTILEPFDCVATDVCGPMHIETPYHEKYFVTFTDIHTGYCEVYFMNSKDQVSTRIKDFVAKWKNQIGKKPKILRCDRGREYINNDVRSFLSHEGIILQCTVGYAPEQNGTAERMNRTLMEAARTMLVDSGLSSCFWAEAIRHACFVFNRCPNNKSNDTPLERFLKMKPNYDEFHEFGCDAYTMIPYEKRRKLDKKAEKARFLGFDELSKGFRVLSLSTRKIIVTREIQFLDTMDHDKSTFEEGEIILLEQDDEDEMTFTPEITNVQLLPPVMSFPQNESLEESDSVMLNGHEDVESQVVVPSLVEEVQKPSSTAKRRTPDLNYSSEEEDFLGFDEEEQETPSKFIRKDGGKEPSAYNKHFSFSADHESVFEPRSYREAMTCPDKDKWMVAMIEELKSIEDNDTWEPADLPAGRKSIGSKWVFKVKLDEFGEISKYKARLVAQGFTQKFGIDFDEVFAPVARSSTLRVLLSVAGKRDYFVKHYDIKSAFLNGELQEEIYLRQPPGFERGNSVLRLKKSLYGLKQAARAWNLALHGVLLECGSVQSENDKCLYRIKNGKEILYILVHVDDILIAGNSNRLANQVSKQINSKFELKDLGLVRHYLGIDVKRNVDGSYSIGQSRYIEKIVGEAGLTNAKISKFPIDTGYYKLDHTKKLASNDEYRKLIGMVLYLATNTRPDIAATVAILSRKVSCPSTVDLKELQRLIRYLSGTRNLMLNLNRKDEMELYAFSDSDWAEDAIDRKSNSGFVVMVNGGAVAWCSRKQSLVSLSSAEAEYIAVTETVKEMLYMERLMRDFDITTTHPLTIFTDSQSCINMLENQRASNRTKHIDTKYHYVRDLVERKRITLKYCPSEENAADLFTKPLGSVKMGVFTRRLGLTTTIEEEC